VAATARAAFEREFPHLIIPLAAILHTVTFFKAFCFCFWLVTTASSDLL